MLDRVVRGIAPAALLLTLLWAAQLRAFPPYRSTDAETAEPWVLETRLGLLRVRHEGPETGYISPLLRLNLGLPASTEIISEFEHRADTGGQDDAALGFKWVPIHWRLDAGVEALALLPIADGQSGAGVESQLLVTFRRDEWRMHVNAGGLYDGRPEPSQSGWRTSGLAEYRIGRWKPGLEIFARQLGGESLEMLAGPGVIVDVGRFDVRIGVHAGLTDASPDLTTNLWVATKFDLTPRRQPPP
jgi:hypothetical protein